MTRTRLHPPCGKGGSLSRPFIPTPAPTLEFVALNSHAHPNARIHAHSFPRPLLSPASGERARPPPLAWPRCRRGKVNRAPFTAAVTALFRVTNEGFVFVLCAARPVRRFPLSSLVGSCSCSPVPFFLCPPLWLWICIFVHCCFFRKIFIVIYDCACVVVR